MIKLSVTLGIFKSITGILLVNRLLVKLIIRLSAIYYRS